MMLDIRIKMIIETHPIQRRAYLAIKLDLINKNPTQLPILKEVQPTPLR